MTFSSTNEKVNEALADSEDKGYLIGTVIDNEDPDGMNKVRVNVPNLMVGDKDGLPWIAPLPYSPFGIGASHGVYGSPQIGDLVAVKFQEGNIYYGFAEGSLLPKSNANAKFKSPKTWGFKDPDGNELFVDIENHKWEFVTHTGTSIKHNANGDLNVHIVRDEITDIVRDSTTTIGGKLHITVTGNVDITAHANLTATVTGNTSVTTTGTTTLASTGATTISSSGAVNITGSSVNLN